MAFRFVISKGLRQLRRIRIPAILCGLIAFITLPSSVAAQVIIPLLQFTNVWRYDAAGTNDDTAWRTDGFDDASWPVGPGLFQYGETTPYPAPFNTDLPAVPGRVTAYFRTTFQMPAEHLVPGLKLFATNLVDDGCVIYLNGTEAARVRMPPGVVGFDTLASSVATTEGQFDTVPLNTASVRAGENLLCVEVHQAALTIGDLVFGQRVLAQVPQELLITSPPVGATNMVGETVTLSVVVTGLPVNYQWLREGVIVPSATNSTYSFGASFPGQSANYSVIASNDRTFLVAGPVPVVIVPDLVGPSLISAIVQDSPASNRVDLTFSERMTAAMTNNFRVMRLTDGKMATVSNVLTADRFMRLTMTGPNWKALDPYLVIVNDVRDFWGNRIAPNTQIGVSWQVTSPALGDAAVWQFHSIAVFDPFVYGEDWTSRSYFPGDWWSQGRGMFYALRVPDTTCAGSFNTDTGYQPEPTLFRTTFPWPADRPSSATLKFRYLIDDGAVFYLNGKEVYHINAPPPPILAGTRALTATGGSSCNVNTSVTVSNLVQGDNVFAVALLQATTGSDEVMFGLSVDAVHLVTPPLPSEPEPRLDITHGPGNEAEVSWMAGGYALESAGDLSGSPQSYPLGALLEITNMTNPYRLSVTNSDVQFFRLKRK